MPRVLIVDDYSDNIFLLEEVLDVLKIEYNSVMNGELAVFAVRDNNYDMVLMDIEMPVMNGFEASEAIRELPDSKNRIPIVAISAHNHDFFEDRIDKSGISDFISKPYTITKLEKIFRKFGLI